MAPVLALVAAAAAGRAAPPTTDAAELDLVVRDACRRDVVLLGEDASHGGGRTIELKTVLVERLLAECGFEAILFESQFYDFLDFERELAAGRATRQGLADAIGALWSKGAEMQPMIDRLFALASQKKVRVGGIDPQVGGVSGYYSQRRLGADLASALAPERGPACRAELDRHHVWAYDAAQPFDAAAKDRIRRCVADIRKALTLKGPEAPAELAATVSSYERYRGMALDGDANARDLGMFENFERYRGRWPRGARVIVWTASVHAAKTAWPQAPWRPFGSYVREALQDRVFAVGFSAVSGSYGRPGGRGPATPVESAAPGSLEAELFAGVTGSLGYGNAQALKKLGRVAGRVLHYAKPQTLDWSEVLDGVVVLREETPPKT